MAQWVLMKLKIRDRVEDNLVHVFSGGKALYFTVHENGVRGKE
jgi:hypothetical protein